MRRLKYAAAMLTTFGLVGFSFSVPARADHASAPENSRPIVIGRSYLIKSKVLGDDRRINVYLPEDYSAINRTFPVVFLLDGGEKEDFHHITGLAQINAAYGGGEEMIVVGVEGVDRKHDLTSPSSSPADQKLLPTSGGAANYRRFLTEELEPWVRFRYRTNGHTGVIGESLAGLFIAETLLRSPSCFDDYIIISPSLWWNNAELADEASHDLQKSGFSGRRVWIAFDDPPPPAARADKDRKVQAKLEEAFAKNKPDDLTWTVTRPGYNHQTIYHPAAMQAFKSLYGAP